MIYCDEQMAKHKSIKFLYHLQREHRFYKAEEVIYGNCNRRCKDCPCGMIKRIEERAVVYDHIPNKILKSGSASASVTEFRLRYGDGK